MLKLVKAKSENVYVYKAKMIIMKWKYMKDMSQVQPMTNSWSYYGLRPRHPKPKYSSTITWIITGVETNDAWWAMTEI
jgi:hypothetical protein